jgi:hypothetical protein
MVPLMETVLKIVFRKTAAVMSCVGCQECQQIFVPSWNFLILERDKKSQGLSLVNNVDDPFL